MVLSHTRALGVNCSSVASASILASGHCGSSTKEVTLLGSLKVMTDVERPFALHRWASCIRPHDSPTWSLQLARHRSQRMQAFLPSRPRRQPLLLSLRL